MVFKNIPTCCMKEVVDICCPILIQIWSKEIINKIFFPANLKSADFYPDSYF